MKPNTTDPNNLWLKVKNFGPIGQAEVELRPLTIFLGSGNAGKSHLATLVHTLHRYFSERDTVSREYGVDPYWAAVTQGAQPRRRRGYPALSKQGGRVFERWLSRAILRRAPNMDSAARWRGMDSVVRSSWEGDHADGEKLALLLRRYFGIDHVGELIRHRSKGGMRVSVSRTGPTNRVLAECTAKLQRSNLAVELSVSPKWSFLPPADTLDRYVEDLEAMQLRSEVGGDAAGVRCAYDRLLSIAPSPFALLQQRSHYLPANRSGIMHVRDAVVSAVIQGAGHTGDWPDVEAPRLSGVASDFLVNLLGTRRRSQPDGLDARVGELEAGLLQGKVQEEHAAGIGYPHFFYRPNGWRGELAIPLSNTSSMVSELAPIVLYLRRVVQQSQLLIIEEPEAHLHPAAQAELAVHLAKLVRSGLRVLLTTHSEWMLERFGNLVQLSSLRRAHRKHVEAQISAIAGAALDKSKVGVWAFEPTGKGGGSSVQEVELVNDAGGMPEQYEVVTRRLYNEWQFIDRHLERKVP